jgi:hypothetical protein
MDTLQVTRRSFFQLALAGAFSLPAILSSTKILAADKCPGTPPAGKAIASPTEGMGKTLHYVVDASKSKHAKYKTGANCGNCKFYNAAKAESGYGPCTMLGMKYVAGCGWCQSYNLKT